MKGKQSQRRPVAGAEAAQSGFPVRGLIATVFAIALVGALVWMLLPGDGLAAEAANEPKVIAGPPPVRAAPDFIDLGEVEVEQTITRVVELVNTSDRTLRVQDVRGNCSCIKGSIAGEQVIRPRGRAMLTLSMDTLSRPSLKNVAMNVVIAGFEEPVRVPVRAQIVAKAE